MTSLLDLGTAVGFKDKLRASEDRARSLLCLGLDPDPELLPAGLSRTPAGVLRFLKDVTDATAEAVASYKLNLAFYERWGKEASDLLSETLALLPADVPVILDGKRGDIGNTAQAYAHAVFEAWGADATTVNPYMGYDSVAPFLAHKDRYVFVLCRTSNPGAQDFQHLRADGETIYRHVARRAVAWDRHGNVGLIAGATAPAELRDVRQIAQDRILLVLGLGAQGGDLQRAVPAALRADGRGAIFAISRGILFASAGSDYAEAAAAASFRYRDAVNALRPEPASASV